jgi:hypothetical protein
MTIGQFLFCRNPVGVSYTRISLINLNRCYTVTGLKPAINDIVIERLISGDPGVGRERFAVFCQNDMAKIKLIIHRARKANFDRFSTVKQAGMFAKLSLDKSTRFEID